jgi:nuclear cap-binding protein subunit 2
MSFLLMSGGWGHQRIEEERRRQEQERLRSQVQFDTYAAVGGLATADVPKGEGVAERQKRERSEDEDIERRDEDKRFRGE